MSEKQTCALDALILEYGCFVPIPGDMRADEELRRMLAAQSAARAELDALRAERDNARAKLATNRCNSGHETLPLVLWDCPACHDVTRGERDALRQRCEDLELMLRKSTDLTGSATMRRHGDRIVIVRDVGAPIYLDFDGTGLPLLTDEARAALRKGAAS